MARLDELLEGLERELGDVSRHDRESVLEDVRQRLRRHAKGDGDEEAYQAFLAVAIEALAASYRAGGLGRPLRRRGEEGKRQCEDEPEHIPGHRGATCCRTVDPEGSD